MAGMTAQRHSSTRARHSQRNRKRREGPRGLPRWCNACSQYAAQGLGEWSVRCPPAALFYDGHHSAPQGTTHDIEREGRNFPRNRLFTIPLPFPPMYLKLCTPPCLALGRRCVCEAGWLRTRRLQTSHEDAADAELEEIAKLKVRTLIGEKRRRNKKGSRSGVL